MYITLPAVLFAGEMEYDECEMLCDSRSCGALVFGTDNEHCAIFDHGTYTLREYPGKTARVMVSCIPPAWTGEHNICLAVQIYLWLQCAQHNYGSTSSITSSYCVLLSLSCDRRNIIVIPSRSTYQIIT